VQSQFIGIKWGPYFSWKEQKMLKKVMLGIVAVILLVGVENLSAKGKEEEDKPKAKQKQVQKDQKKQKSRAKQLHKQKAGKQTAPKRRKASQKKRRQKVTKEAEAKKAKAEKARAEKAKAEKARAEKAKAAKARAEKVKAAKARAERAKAAAAARKRPEQVRGKSQQLRPGANLPRQQMFSKWLDELTNAYRENDREKMGQLIRKMHQLRQRVRKAMSAPGEAGRALRDRPKATAPKVTDRPSRRKPPESIDRPSGERRREVTDRRKRGSPEPKRLK